jgi:co-chaperonin GroES (HSP10)
MEEKIIPYGNRILVKEIEVKKPETGFVAVFTNKNEDILRGEVVSSNVANITPGTTVIFKKWEAINIPNTKLYALEDKFIYATIAMGDK